MSADLAYLDGLTDYESTGRSPDPTITGSAALAAALGHPQRAYPVIHVSGTIGKGSTTAMIARLLETAGLRVGTYTSPHIHDVGERITVDSRWTPPERVAAAVREVRAAAERCAVTPSWFEAFTAAAFWELAQRAVDVAVVEVGMLGRWDATNVVDASVVVITNVELDHADLAGPTRADIAYEKAGIVRPGATLVLGETDSDLLPLFTKPGPDRVLLRHRDFGWTSRRTLTLGSVVDVRTPGGCHENIRVAMSGRHQCDNAALALTAAEAFLGSRIAVGSAAAALSAVRVPGRTEVVGRAPLVLLDGAHNPAGAAALRSTVDELATTAGRKVLVCGVLAGRVLAEFLTSIGVGDYDLVVATWPDSPRAQSAAAVAATASWLGTPAVTVPDPAQALLTAIESAGTDGVVVGAGSLHLVGTLRRAADTVQPAARPASTR